MRGLILRAFGETDGLKIWGKFWQGDDESDGADHVVDLWDRADRAFKKCGTAELWHLLYALRHRLSREGRLVVMPPSPSKGQSWLDYE